MTRCQRFVTVVGRMLFDVHVPQKFIVISVRKRFDSVVLLGHRIKTCIIACSIIVDKLMIIGGRAYHI